MKQSVESPAPLPAAAGRTQLPVPNNRRTGACSAAARPPLGCKQAHAPPYNSSPARPAPPVTYGLVGRVQHRRKIHMVPHIGAAGTKGVSIHLRDPGLAPGAVGICRRAREGSGTGQEGGESVHSLASVASSNLMVQLLHTGLLEPGPAAKLTLVASLVPCGGVIAHHLSWQMAGRSCRWQSCKQCIRGSLQPRHASRLSALPGLPRCSEASGAPPCSGRRGASAPLLTPCLLFGRADLRRWRGVRHGHGQHAYWRLLVRAQQAAGATLCCTAA